MKKKKILSMLLAGTALCASMLFGGCGTSGSDSASSGNDGKVVIYSNADDEAVDAFEYLSRTEGIIPAIESAHAVAYAKKLAPTMGKGQIIVINISGRGDKDCAAIARYRGENIYD